MTNDIVTTILDALAAHPDVKELFIRELTGTETRSTEQLNELLFTVPEIRSFSRDNPQRVFVAVMGQVVDRLLAQ